MVQDVHSKNNGGFQLLTPQVLVIESETGQWHAIFVRRRELYALARCSFKLSLVYN